MNDIEYVKAKFTKGIVTVFYEDDPANDIIIKLTPNKPKDGTSIEWIKSELEYSNGLNAPIHHNRETGERFPIFNSDEWMAITQMVRMFSK